jgi:hypothetical protein
VLKLYVARIRQAFIPQMLAQEQTVIVRVYFNTLGLDEKLHSCQLVSGAA